MHAWTRTARATEATLGLLLALTAAGEAWANSGEVSDVYGLYTIPKESCDVVRTNNGAPPDPGNGEGIDIIIPCSANTRDGTRVCDLQTASGDDVLPVGQCEDSFDRPLVPIRADTLERNVTVGATSFGINSAYDAGSPARPDVICNTFVRNGNGVNDCVKVFPGTGTGPSLCGSIRVSNNAAACAEVRNQLQVLTANPPALSHYWGIDVQETSREGYLTLSVCPDAGYRWECVSAAAPLNNVKAYDELSIATAFTPVCLVLSRKPPLCPKG